MVKRIAFALFYLLSLPLMCISLPITMLLAIISGIKWVATGKGDEEKEPGIFVVQDWAVNLPYTITGLDF